jgi:hypothetical protein
VPVKTRQRNTTNDWLVNSIACHYVRMRSVRVRVRVRVRVYGRVCNAFLYYYRLKPSLHYGQITISSNLSFVRYYC